MAARTLRVIKRGGFSDIDDWEAPSSASLMGAIRRTHNLGKTSSWTEIGPVGNRDPGGIDPMRHVQYKHASILKEAEPPPPEGVSSKEWDKILESRKRTDRIRDKLAYRLQGHTDVQGLPIAIENRKGSVRKGKDENGHEWRTKMQNPYGYIVGTKGADGEEVDAYVGPDKQAPKAYVVHQHKPDGTGYDEDKVMLGFRSKKDAKEAYLAHYDSPKFLGPMSAVPIERLRELVASKRKLVKIAKAEPKKSVFKRVRKAGPGLGGLVGAGIGAVIGARRGRPIKGALAGLGTGATLGWTPDMAANVAEAFKGK